MTNIFVQYPEFIESDPRKNRQATMSGGYNVNANFQYVKHITLIPPDCIQGKRILDLGSCVGASGAWALSNGASRYVGVELQEKFCDIARKNLQNRFPDYNWLIRNESFTRFFESNTEQFDIILAWGILYQSIHVDQLLKNITSLNAKSIIIDTASTLALKDLLRQFNVDNPEILKEIEKLPLVEYRNFSMVSEESGNKFKIESALMSMSALQIIMKNLGYCLESDLTQTLIGLSSKNYLNRYCGVFTPITNKSPESLPDFETAYTDPKKKILIPQSNTMLYGRHWVFDSNVANQFGEHARQHIPQYDQVIDLSVDICLKQFADPHVCIIDVGSAVGETIQRLYIAGFDNLVGVDNSASMIEKVQHLSIAKWIQSDQFPTEAGPYSAVICNWTLHFIKDKQEYLTQIYNNLLPGGLLILTDKTTNDGIDLELYHDFKRKQGVPNDVILAKSESLKDVMFIESAQWYFARLPQVGFDRVSIVNANCCFTTFLAIKNN
jgi:tRNA (cmo5U34)-methyltransferase